MGFYTLNRVAINAGVASFIAGAALLASTSTVEASATRVVLPEASAVLTSNAQAAATRRIFGVAGFVGGLTGSAFPALLQLQSADIHSSGSFRATYTEAWANQFSQLESTGTITRPGSGVALSVLSVTAVPLADVGFASTILCTSWAAADASVKRSGQSTTERDGYARQAFSSLLVADGLRTALARSSWGAASSLIADATKTHGGAADLAGKLTITVIASTDKMQSNFLSDMTATAIHIQAGEALVESSGSCYADPIAIIPGYPQEMASLSGVSATGRLAQLAEAGIFGTGQLTAKGTRVHLGYGVSGGLLTASAEWSLLIDGEATVVAGSSMTALAYTNAEAQDPPSRTMRRITVDRVMRRPYVNRVMRRQA